MYVKDCYFAAACAPPSGGSNIFISKLIKGNPVTPRLFRHFNMIWVPDLS
jgi:dynein heavy chain